MKKKKVWVLPAGVFLAAVMSTAVFLSVRNAKTATAAETLNAYVEALNGGDYEAMYRLLDDGSRKEWKKDDFTERNQKIYEGIEASDVSVRIIHEGSRNRTSGQTTQNLTYEMKMNTAAGELSFTQTATFHKKTGEDYLLSWNDSLIFPDLEKEDRVKAETLNPERGNIYDRSGILLAGQGVVSSVGLVPGKMSEDPSEDLEKLALLLDTTVETIREKLSASWVREDSFVPVRKIKKSGLDMEVLGKASMNKPSEDSLAGQLLQIPGVMITDVSERVYPLGEAAAHLVGYVQNITAEELEEHQGEGYTADSVIGKSGVESLYEEELRGNAGFQIMIVDSEGKDKELVLRREAMDGADITLTVDAKLQQKLYETYRNDKSVSVAMNPRTGEVLALVSTPSYDDNLFVLGMSEKTWRGLSEDENQPMLNRFRSVFVPGSSFKPVIAGIGLTAGILNAEEDFGAAGRSWQADKDWGDYYVTTLHPADPANLRNALVLSDNIYFARAALKIGQDTLIKELDRLGFQKRIPFEIRNTESAYANESGQWSEIQLADTGYGQGELLVNPLHLAGIYTAFVNDGNMIRPWLRMDGENGKQIWVDQAFSAEAAGIVRNDMIEVVEDPEGTAHGCRKEGVTLAAKTGTAEIKNNKEDTAGTELGWLSVMTVDTSEQDSILLVTMVEDVKDRGGSGYVVSATSELLDGILQNSSEN